MIKIRILLASGDTDYLEHLSRVLTERHGDTFEVSVCSDRERLQEMAANRGYDVALLGSDFAGGLDRKAVRLAFLLWDGVTPADGQMKMIQKYQRVSGIVSTVLEAYSEVSREGGQSFEKGARVTVVWSPGGGSGKTTVALAYTAQLVSKGRRAVYLDLEAFSSVDTYFDGSGKSISKAFEKLDGDGGVAMLLQSIRREDSDSGILYFCKPDNYDDVNILTRENLLRLVDGCGAGVDEVVVDLSSLCDERTRCLMERADQVLAVVDATRACAAKWEQFRTQHDLYGQIQEKLTVVANRGARLNQGQANRLVALPALQSGDPLVVYKSLSSGYFSI